MNRGLILTVILLLRPALGICQSETTSSSMAHRPKVNDSLQWKEEPIEFKGVAFGSNFKDFAASVTIPGAGNYCVSRIEPPACVPKLKVGDFSIDLAFIFDANKLSRVVGTFPVKNFPDVVDMFEGKYGSAHSSELSSVQSNAGVNAEQARLTWAGPHVVISLRRFGETIDRGIFSISTVAVLERDSVEMDAAKKNALN
ncbi:MAG: hypothetical protein JWN34_2003 [Bryobacterales bacterium]|nr:hypothetical protein [Bryobacterales bacterium]